MEPAPSQLRPGVSPVTAGPSLPSFGGAGARQLAASLDQLAPMSLAHLDAVSLLSRFDTKFLLTTSQVLSVLPSLAQDYRVLELEGRRLHQYQTLYFDTPDFELYRLHHAGRPERHKVRCRTYLDTGLTYFEIKSKSAERRTVKHRLAMPTPLAEITPEASAFVKRHIGMDAQALRPMLRNDFFRVTLGGKRCAERLTIDVSVQFDCDGRTAVLPGIAIVEVKQSELDRESPFLQRMQAAQVLPSSVSKYCLGVGLLVADVEHDAFEEQLQAIERLTHAESEALSASRAEVAAAGH